MYVLDIKMTSVGVSLPTVNQTIVFVILKPLFTMNNNTIKYLQAGGLLLLSTAVALSRHT